MADHVARCLGCGKTLGETNNGQWVKWTLTDATGLAREIEDFVCGNCTRATVMGGVNSGYAERIACPRCGGGTSCRRCEGGLIFRRPDVAKAVGAVNPATVARED